MSSSTPALALAYRSLWRAAWPLVRWYVCRKDARRLLDAHATQERFGRSRRPSSWEDPRAWVLWIHGASVGECLSALPVVEFALSPRCAVSEMPPPPDRRVVVTTTTAAARRLLQQRLDQNAAIGGRAVCVFAPLDAPESVARFYDNWRPDAGVWIESELWPTLVLEASRRQIPIGLLNARISPQSLRWWSLPLVRSLIRDVVARFSLVLCQDVTNQTRFHQLGALSPQVAVNLKFASSWQASDSTALHRLRCSLQNRTTWLVVSTHDDEELLMARLHENVANAVPRSKPLLTVIIPRHPERTSAIVRQIQQSYPSLRISLRSTNDAPSTETDVYIADTLGETALFFDAIDTVVMGGTFVQRGGHNPIEPLRAGCTVAVGPHAFNFTDIIDQLKLHGVPLVQVSTTDTLGRWLRDQLSNDTQSRDATKHQMAALFVQAMTTYETAMLRWLTADSRRSK